MVCDDFKYPKLLQYFEEISAIPRMSYHEERIAEYLVDFAKKRGLEYYVDEARNVLINIDATEGYENSPAVLLQGHTDMVCEKNAGVEHDFLSEGLELYVENGYLRAKGTTLGADDGIAIAFMLALLDGAVEHHPRCQCLFTSAEEVGLDGIKSFDFDRIYARTMFNMDGAEEDIVIIGCAGGLRSDVEFDIHPEKMSEARCLTVDIGGLVGGHSGENIGEGRANACKLAGELLLRLCDGVGARLVRFDGGNKDNSIPREATLVVAMTSDKDAKALIEDFKTEKARGLCELDGGFFVRYSVETRNDISVLSEAQTKSLADFVNSVDNGVLRMSDKIPGLVEYSRNLGIVATESCKIGFYFSSRSSVAADLDASASEIETRAARYGGRTKHHSRYPSWTYTGVSELADAYIETAKRLYGLEVRKTVLHAGLECGIVKEHIPEMQIVSCGANASNIHSPAEALELASFERFFGILKDLLEKMA